MKSFQSLLAKKLAMIRFGVDENTSARLVAALNNSAKEIRKSVAVAVNATAKATSRQVARQISEELMLTIKDAQKGIDFKLASSSSLQAEVVLDDDDRIPLRDFGARQTSKGVSYKISRKGKRTTIAGAFIVDKLNGRVFRRVGEKRLRIVQLFGPSPLGVVAKEGQIEIAVKFANDELKKQVERRIQFAEFKKGK